MALYDSENNRLLDVNDNVLLARTTFTIGTQEANKVFVGENEVKAIYIGDNLVYEKPIVLPQLDTPVISLSEDTLSIEEVENAEYYDIYVDGVLEESVPVVEPTFDIVVDSYEEYGSATMYFSTDNGTTWTEITGTGTIATGVSQIKFKNVRTEYNMGVDNVRNTSYGTSEILWYDWETNDVGTVISDNFTIYNSETFVQNTACVPTNSNTLHIGVYIETDD